MNKISLLGFAAILLAGPVAAEPLHAAMAQGRDLPRATARASTVAIKNFVAVAIPDGSIDDAGLSQPARPAPATVARPAAPRPAVAKRTSLQRLAMADEGAAYAPSACRSLGCPDFVLNGHRLLILRPTAVAA